MSICPFLQIFMQKGTNWSILNLNILNRRLGRLKVCYKSKKLIDFFNDAFPKIIQTFNLFHTFRDHCSIQVTKLWEVWVTPTLHPSSVTLFSIDMFIYILLISTSYPVLPARSCVQGIQQQILNKVHEFTFLISCNDNIPRNKKLTMVTQY